MWRPAFVLLCAAPLPALADTTARYAMGQGGQTLVVEIEDGGDARVDFADVLSVIRHAGADYVSLTVKGEKLLVRLDDAVTVMKAELAASPEAGHVDGPAFVLGGGAATQIAGFDATSWTLGPKDGSKEGVLEIAVSEDPELASVGTLLRRLADSVLSVIDGTVFPASAQFGVRLREVLAKGTPVQIAPFLELESIDHNEIDAHRFDLPGPVMSAEELTKATGPKRVEAVGPL